MINLTMSDIRILNCLVQGRSYFISELTKITNISYPHIEKRINILSKEDLIERSKSGRKIYLKLTKKGIILAMPIKDLFTALDTMGGDLNG